METVPGPRLGPEKEPELWGIGPHSPEIQGWEIPVGGVSGLSGECPSSNLFRNPAGDRLGFWLITAPQQAIKLPENPGGNNSVNGNVHHYFRK